MVPLHAVAEAMALWWAIQEVQRIGGNGCMLYTDCETLVKVVTNLSPPLHVEWRAYAEIFECWKMIDEDDEWEIHL